MNRKETFKRITAINEQLLQNGYSFAGIEKFWNECFEEAKNKIKDSKKEIQPACELCFSNNNKVVNFRDIKVCKKCYLDSV